MIIQTSDQDIENIFNRINNGLYDLKPDFQRDIVWNREKQQKLIDSIMRGWHIPPIHLVKIEGKDYYEVLDGKQRLYSIYNFLNDKFAFNAHFIPGVGDFDEFHRKKYSQLPDEIKKGFLFTKIRIFEVSDVKMNEATELFLRLNLGVTVAASEKRNCIYGPTKNFLRDILNEYPDLFSKKTLGFSNLRMAYQDVLDKIFFLEKNRNLEKKPNSRALEKMYFEQTLDYDAMDNLRSNLKITENVLKNTNFKLTKSTLISYYWFLRYIRLTDYTNEIRLSDFLQKFEEWRSDQKSQLEKEGAIHAKYIEYEALLSEGWLDSSSLNGRHKILVDFHQDYLSHRKFGDL